VDGVTISLVTPDNDVPQPLPARRRRTRPGGRHRGADSFAVPSDAPALILAAHGVSGALGAQVVADLASMTEAAHPGLAVRTAQLRDDTEGLMTVLGALGTESLPGQEIGVNAVVVPLVTGPYPEFEEALRKAVAGTPANVSAVVAQPLGPHPVIAQALHTRLAEAGLARADRVRLLTMVTAADGVIVGVTGGDTAVGDAEVTSVLLASRLAVPVLPVLLDGGSSVAAAAAQLRNAGSARVALAPCVIGPEADPVLIARAAAEAGTECAEPIGAHPALVQLIAVRYAEALERAWAAE
jgi:sirohydrochlorin ferrochelatase